MKPTLIVLGVAVAVVVGFGVLSTGVDSAREPSSAPAWTLENLDGEPVSFSEFKGKVVILDFWATWCGPCRKEIPSFIELQEEYGEEGLVVIGISLDQEGPVVVKEFAEKMGINYPLVMGNREVTETFGGVQGIPTTFVIDRDGEIVSKHVGYTDKSVFVEEIEPLLNGEKESASAMVR